MSANRPLEGWGKLIGDVPSATAILDRFLHHAEIVTINGKSCRLREQARSRNDQPKPGHTDQANVGHPDDKPLAKPQRNKVKDS